MTGNGVKREVGGERCGTHIRPSLPTPILTRYISKRLNSASGLSTIPAQTRPPSRNIVHRKNLIIVSFVFFFYNYVCECTVGVDVGDGTTINLLSIL